MPRKELVIPSFQTEVQEAEWWENHRTAVESNLRSAMREAKTAPLNETVKQAKQKNPRLPEEDTPTDKR
jgi:hypothetical protein